MPIIPHNLANEIRNFKFDKLYKDLNDNEEFNLKNYLNTNHSILGLQLPL